MLNIQTTIHSDSEGNYKAKKYNISTYKDKSRY